MNNKYNDYNKYLYNKVIELYRKGYDEDKIASELVVPTYVVQNIINKELYDK